MLEIVAKGFENAKAALTGKTTLTAENIDTAVKAIRVSLLEADVELNVVRSFLARVKERAIGEVVTTQVKVDGKRRRGSPADHFTLICHNELEKLMGPRQEAPIVYQRPVTVLMMVGLQGVGKTTTCGKMAKYLVAEGRRPLLVGADIYRPAAQAQLQILGDKLKVPVFAPTGMEPASLCEAALAHARQQKRDVVIFDTAGRLAIDAALMGELEQIKRSCKPHEILLVTDAMAGQDSVRTAKAFDDRLALTGLVMTKLDGDARGGAALSMKEVLGKPIKFLGTGEALDKLERFRPEGLASRILGMGDLVGLMHDFEQVVDEKKAEQDAKKMLRGQFTLDDFLVQLGHLQKLGSIKDILAKMPGMGGGKMPQVDEKTFTTMRAMIQSMTRQERQDPSKMNPSRITRVARGSGRQEAEVKGLLDRFGMMQKMMASLRGGAGGLMGMAPGFKQMAKAARSGGGMQRGMGMPQGIAGGMPPSMPGGLPAGLGGGAPQGLGERLAALAKKAGGALPGLPSGGVPGLPGTGSEAAEATPSEGDLAGMGGWPMGALAGARGPSHDKGRQKTKDKRKAEKKARKKGRR